MHLSGRMDPAKPAFLELGARAEALALEFLSTPQRKLLARNYRCKMGEIDLIFEETAPQGGVELVFVEVRARVDGWVSGAESVDGAKQRRLRRAAQRYLLEYEGLAQTLRFDVLDWDGRGWLHLENAWS